MGENSNAGSQETKVTVDLVAALMSAGSRAAVESDLRLVFGKAVDNRTGLSLLICRTFVLACVYKGSDMNMYLY